MLTDFVLVLFLLVIVHCKVKYKKRQPTATKTNKYLAISVIYKVYRY